MNGLAPRVSPKCPVCGGHCVFAFAHPEGDIHRCTGCTHRFTDPTSLRGMEKYGANYFEEAHRNWFNNPDLKLFDWIEQRLPRGAKSIIDVGCGRGQFLDFMKDQRSEIASVGVDIAPNVTRKGITFYQGDILALELGHFDCLVSLQVIEHIADVQEFAARLRELTNPGGTIVISTIAEDSVLFWLARVAKRLRWPVVFDRLYSAHHLQHFRRRSLARLIVDHGFRIEQTLIHNPPLRAIDTPVMPPILRPFTKAILVGLLAAGTLSGRSYLQTIVATKVA
jgi:2-polyprenyl-3-methyl-5-hydroxy-6-metoxy-1,4-benzoquinol methylase